MTVTHAQTQVDPASTTTPDLQRILLMRQIMPANRDTDVIKLYVDPEPAALDADKFELGTSRAAHEANAIASSTVENVDLCFQATNMSLRLSRTETGGFAGM